MNTLNMQNSKGTNLLMFAVICLFFLAGCADIGDTPEQILSKTDGKHLILTNATQDTLYYFLCPTSLLPVVDWLPCTDPQSCSNRVLPQSTRVLDTGSFWWIQSDGEFAEITVCWWRLVRQTDDSYIADHIVYERRTIQ
jgi:hypothetical protein